MCISENNVQYEIRIVFRVGEIPCVNTEYYYPYRAFGGQNIIVYSTRFVTRREILLILPGQYD